MTEQTVPTKSLTWPYTSFRSLMNVLDRFKAGLPPRIDRSVLGGSEGQKTAIIGTMRFFGFVRENGDVTDVLKRVVKADDKQRQQIVKELLAAHYQKATELASINATTKQLEETFDGVTGETLRKAMAFYLAAAKYSGHPTSPHFKIPPFVSRSGGLRRQPNTALSNGGEGGEESAATVADPKARYIEMLMERTKTAQGEEAEKLLDRIERLLGYPTKAADEYLER